MDFVSNCGAYASGSALQIRQGQFNNFYGSYGNAANSVYLTAGQSFGNVFHSLDMESTTNVKIDSANAYSNTFLAGQYSYDQPGGGYGINASAGSSNQFFNTAFGAASNQLNGTTGICLMGGSSMPGSYANCAGISATSPGGSSGNIQYNNGGAFGGLTDTQLTTHINAFSSSLSGAVPASGGGTTNFMRADGTWAAPAGGSSGMLSSTWSGSGSGNTATTSEVTLYSYNIPANTLDTNGETIKASCYGLTAANGNNKVVKLCIGGLCTSSGTITDNNKGWSAEMTVGRVSTDVQLQYGKNEHNGTWAAPFLSSNSQDDGATIEVKCVGQSPTSGAANDVKAYGFTVEQL